MRKLILELTKKKEAAERSIADAKSTILATTTALRAIQDICEHKHADGTDALEYTGHDSHHDHYECTICGKWISA